VTASPDAARTSKAAAVALAALGAVMLGPALPIERGWGLPVVAVLVLVALSVWRDAGGAYREDDTLGPGRLAAVALVWLSGSVLIAAAVGIAAAITIAFPGAIWALPVVVLGTFAAGWAGPRARLPVAIGMALLVPAAGIFGARYEESAEHARGWAHSGPIHGIHPFQMTSVSIDGYGPFDLPINDYVEPEGTRGYSPQTYADAVERALHAIADIHFAQGPARARRAFAAATVEASSLPAVEETLGVSPGAETQPRVLVTSGSWGQHSTVQFVCPGKRDEAGGPDPDDLLNRMCPSKYAAEASAGLGVTGRWPGYTEARGQPRVGLAPARGRTRTRDAQGVRLRRDERVEASLIWLGIAFVLLALAPARKFVVRGASRFAAAVGVAALSAVIVLAFETTRGVGGVGMVESGLPTAGWTAWLPALLLFAGMPEIRARAGVSGSAWTGVIMLVATAAVAASVARLGWGVPDLRWGADGTQPLEAWIIGAGDLLSNARGLDVFETERGIAAMLVAMLAGGAWAILTRAATSLAGNVPWVRDQQDRVRIPIAGLLLILTAASLAISRKTFGGATLVPGAIGLTVVLHSGLAWARHHTPWRGVLLAASALGVAWLWLYAVGQSSAPDQLWPKIYAAVGILVSLSGLAFFASRRP
jgi:hypothetical protein